MKVGGSGGDEVTQTDRSRRSIDRREVYFVEAMLGSSYSPTSTPTSRFPSLVFAYGSNLFEARMVGRVPSARVLGTAVLPRHTLRFHMRSSDGSGKADAHFTNRPADRVEGVIYRVSPGGLSVLDHYEGGYSRELHRFRLKAPDHGGEAEAWAYHARPERIDHRLRPFDWYHRFVMEGARSQGIAPAYLQRIERVPVVRTGGRPPRPLL